MKRFLVSVVWAGALTVFLGCGREGYQGLTDFCSEDFVSEYNRVQHLARIATGEQALRDARSNALEFKEKYSGVSCQAEIPVNAWSTTKKQIVVNADEKMNDLVSSINTRLSAF